MLFTGWYPMRSFITATLATSLLFGHAFAQDAIPPLPPLPMPPGVAPASDVPVPPVAVMAEEAKKQAEEQAAGAISAPAPEATPKIELPDLAPPAPPPTVTEVAPGIAKIEGAIVNNEAPVPPVAAEAPAPASSGDLELPAMPSLPDLPDFSKITEPGADVPMPPMVQDAVPPALPDEAAKPADAPVSPETAEPQDAPKSPEKMELPPLPGVPEQQEADETEPKKETA